MLLGEALIARIEADAAVTAIVGTKVHWVARPQPEGFPALVLQVISGDRPEDLKGVATMRTTRIQGDCLALEKAKGGGGYAEARNLAEAFVAALLPEATVDDVVFWRATATEPRDLGEQTDTGFVHRVSVDLILRWMNVV